MCQKDKKAKNYKSAHACVKTWLYFKPKMVKSDLFTTQRPNLFGRWTSTQISRGGSRRIQAKERVKNFVNSIQIRKSLEEETASAHEHGGKLESMTSNSFFACGKCRKYYKVCECDGCSECREDGPKHPKKRCEKCHPVGEEDDFDSYDSENLSDEELGLLGYGVGQTDLLDERKEAIRLYLKTCIKQMKAEQAEQEEEQDVPE